MLEALILGEISNITPHHKSDPIQRNARERAPSSPHGVLRSLVVQNASKEQCPALVHRHGRRGADRRWRALLSYLRDTG